MKFCDEPRKFLLFLTFKIKEKKKSNLTERNSIFILMEVNLIEICLSIKSIN